MTFRNTDVTASTEARYSRAISSYLSSQNPKDQHSDTANKYPRATSRYRATSQPSGMDEMPASSGRSTYETSSTLGYDSDDGYKPSIISRGGSASSTGSTATSRRTSNLMNGGRHMNVGSEPHTASSRTNRLLTSQQFTTNSSSSIYHQPSTLLELLRQPLIVLDSNMKIEKFNEDKGDLEAKTRTPTVKVMTKRDPLSLKKRQTTSTRAQSKSEPIETSPPVENDSYSLGAYQPRVPSRKATSDRGSEASKTNDRYSDRYSEKSNDRASARGNAGERSTSRVATVSKAPQSTSRYGQNNDVPRTRSKSEYSDNYSQNSEDSHYSEYKSKQPSSRAPSSKRAPAPTSTINSNPYPEEVEDYVEVQRTECHICGRKFAVDRIEKHVKACKVSNKPRKQFDISKQRLDAEARQLATRSKREESKKKVEMPANKMPKWKRDHLQFQQILRAGRPQKPESFGGYSSSSAGGYRPQEEEEIIDDRVPCPHCGRKFNSDVADRHIPRCKNVINKPKTIRRGEGNAAGVSALTSRTTTKPSFGLMGNTGMSQMSSMTGTRRVAPLSSRHTTRMKR